MHPQVSEVIFSFMPPSFCAIVDPHIWCVCFSSFQLQAETRHSLWANGLLAFLKKDLCGRLWKAGHHPVVEGVRRALSQAASPEEKEGEHTVRAPSAQLRLVVWRAETILCHVCLLLLEMVMHVQTTPSCVVTVLCPFPALLDTYLRFLDMASSFYREEMSELQRRLEFTLPELLDPTRTHSSQVQRCLGYTVRPV